MLNQDQINLFKNRSFCCYAISALLAMVSYGMSYIALTWIVLHYHEAISIKPVVLLMFCFWLPSVFLSPIAGAIVDRVDRRRLFIFTSWSRGILLFSLGVIEWKYKSLSAIYIMALFEGIVSSFVWPAVTALLREIVPEDMLLPANANIDTIYELGNVIGMAIAGFAIALLSNAGSLMADGILFFLATIFAYGIKTPYKEMVVTVISFKSIMEDIIQGLHYIFKHTGIKVVYTLQLFSLVSYMVVPVLTAPFAQRYLHATVTQFGYLEALLSIGIVLGNICAPTLARRFGSFKTLLVLHILLVICFAWFAMNRSLIDAYILNFFIGLGFASWALITTRTQELTALNFQGRVSSSFSTLSSVVMLLVYTILYFEGPLISLHLIYYLQVIFIGINIILLLRYYRLFRPKKNV